MVPRYPDCTSAHHRCACHQDWYQDSPIVPMLGNTIGTKIPRLYQHFLHQHSLIVPMATHLVPGFPDCTNLGCQCWYQDSPIVPMLANNVIMMVMMTMVMVVVLVMVMVMMMMLMIGQQLQIRKFSV